MIIIGDVTSRRQALIRNSVKAQKCWSLRFCKVYFAFSSFDCPFDFFFVFLFCYYETSPDSCHLSVGGSDHSCISQITVGKKLHLFPHPFTWDEGIYAGTSEGCVVVCV